MLKAIIQRFKRPKCKYMELMFDAIPLSVSLWDRDVNAIDCNQESLRLFNLSDKDDFRSRFQSLAPEYQPCGGSSDELRREYIQKAFSEGSFRFLWTHQTTQGVAIPCDILLVRIEHMGTQVVAAYVRDLRELNETLNAMHKVEDELRLALEVAEDTAKAKGEFLGNMSHELRTPMNGILGFLRLASQTDDDEERQQHLADAERSAQGLMKTISDVLDFTEIEDEKMKMNAVQFSLKDVLADLHNKYLPAANAKNLELYVRPSKDIPEMLHGDLQKLTKILTSLIDNAIKFTDTGKITVRADAKPLADAVIELSFYVRDTGIGITPEQMRSLFEPFWQADASLTRKYGGAGFGLALSKHLVTFLGGKIWVESIYEEGSTFYFTSRFSLADSEEEPQRNERVPDELPEAPVSEEEEPKHDGMKLLVVEDIEINQIIAVELLKDMGYTVDVAGNGQEALDMLRLKQYDAILMDIQMPVLDGLAATLKIREEEKYKKLPIIAVTAHSMTADKEKSLAYGMNDHLTKPLDPDKLSATLQKWLESA